MARNVFMSPSSGDNAEYEYEIGTVAKNNSGSKINVSSDSYGNNTFFEESPKTKFGEWLNEFNDTHSNESNSQSSRSQIEISKSGVFKIDDYIDHTPESNSPLHFTPRDCWLEENVQCPQVYRSPAYVSSSLVVFNTSPYTPRGCNTSTPFSQIPNFEATPIQNVPRPKYVPNISPEIAREKCSHLRKIRLQTPSKKETEFQSKFSERYTPRRSSLNDVRSARLSIKQHSTIRKTQRERLSWPRSGRDWKRSLKENFSLSYSSKSDSSWEYRIDGTEVKPMLKSYQFLGDSLLVRFAEQVLYNQVQMIEGTRTIGLCVSGQKIMDLYRKILMKKYPVTEKIVLLIGTNDILQNTDDDDMQQTLKNLLNELLGNYANRIVLLTIPPIPKLQDRENQWQRIEMYNSFIKSLKDERIAVADINELYLEDPRSCKLDCFEKFYGDGVRKDLIHLNKNGLKEIYNFLTENNFLT